MEESEAAAKNLKLFFWTMDYKELAQKIHASRG